MLKVFVVAGFEPLRTGLAEAITSGAPSIEVTGSACTLREMAATGGYRQADVLVIDTSALSPGNPEAIDHSLRDWLPGQKILFLGSDEDARTIHPDNLPAYMSLGSVGFLLKDGPADRVLEAIRLVASGAFVCEMGVVGRMLMSLTRADDNGASDERRLSDREMQVLMGVAQGRSNREVAHDLFLSEATIKAHVSHIMAKLGFDRRTELVRYALAAGLLPTNGSVTDPARVTRSRRERHT